MKRSLFLLATFTLSSALYGQNTMTREQAREVFAAYNPALLEKAAQDGNLNQFVESVLAQYISQNPPDTLESCYTLIALARNFENSLTINAALDQYRQALIYAQQSGNDRLADAARTHAAKELSATYPRIWAVSVQVKEDLLSKYKQNLRSQETPAADKKDLQAAIVAAQVDLKELRTHTGEQLVSLTKEALYQTKEQVLADQATLQTKQSENVKATSNLQIKTNHKKPVAE